MLPREIGVRKIRRVGEAQVAGNGTEEVVVSRLGWRLDQGRKKYFPRVPRREALRADPTTISRSSYSLVAHHQKRRAAKWRPFVLLIEPCYLPRLATLVPSAPSAVARPEPVASLPQA